MTSFVHVDFPTEHAGVVRFERAAAWLQDFLQSRPLLRLLAALGRPVLAVQTAWQQRAADARFLEAARFDARLMADISRAMDAEARRFGRV